MRIETQSTAVRDVAANVGTNQNVTASVTRLDVTARQLPAGNDKPLPDAGVERVDGEELKAAVQNINDFVQRVQRTLQFSVDDDTGTTVVKVLNSETDEVVRQFPPEEALALARHLQASEETQAQDNSGLILHARA